MKRMRSRNKAPSSSFLHTLSLSCDGDTGGGPWKMRNLWDWVSRKLKPPYFGFASALSLSPFQFARAAVQRPLAKLCSHLHHCKNYNKKFN